MTGKLTDAEAWGDTEIDELEPPSQKKKIQDYANRKLPVMLDILIFLLQLVIFVGYLYMTFFYGDLNTITCKADAGLDVPISPISSLEGVDVSARFKMAIRWGFWMSFLNFARATLAQFAFYLKMWVLLLISYTMFAMNIAILIILFVMMQLWRWEHSGRVCAGDFLDEVTEEDKKIYLLQEGMFI